MLVNKTYSDKTTNTAGRRLSAPPRRGHQHPPLRTGVIRPAV